MLTFFLGLITFIIVKLKYEFHHHPQLVSQRNAGLQHRPQQERGFEARTVKAEATQSQGLSAAGLSPAAEGLLEGSSQAQRIYLQLRPEEDLLAQALASLPEEQAPGKVVAPHEHQAAQRKDEKKSNRVHQIPQQPGCNAAKLDLAAWRVVFEQERHHSHPLLQARARSWSDQPRLTQNGCTQEILAILSVEIECQLPPEHGEGHYLWRSFESILDATQTYQFPVNS